MESHAPIVAAQPARRAPTPPPQQQHAQAAAAASTAPAAASQPPLTPPTHGSHVSYMPCPTESTRCFEDSLFCDHPDSTRAETRMFDDDPRSYLNEFEQDMLEARRAQAQSLANRAAPALEALSEIEKDREECELQLQAVRSALLAHGRRTSQQIKEQNHANLVEANEFNNRILNTHHGQITNPTQAAEAHFHSTQRAIEERNQERNECLLVAPTMQQRSDVRAMLQQCIHQRVVRGMTPVIKKYEMRRVLGNWLGEMPNRVLHAAVCDSGFPLAKTSKQLMLDNVAKLCDNLEPAASQKLFANLEYHRAKRSYGAVKVGTVITPLAVLLALYKASLVDAATTRSDYTAYEYDEDRIRNFVIGILQQLHDAFTHASGHISAEYNEFVRDHPLLWQSALLLIQACCVLAAVAAAVFIADAVCDRTRTLMRSAKLRRPVQLKKEQDADTTVSARYTHTVHYGVTEDGRAVRLENFPERDARSEGQPEAVALIQQNQYVTSECSIQGSALFVTLHPTYLAYISIAFDGDDKPSTFVGACFRYKEVLVTCGHNNRAMPGMKVTLKSAKGEVSYIHTQEMCSPFGRTLARFAETGHFIATPYNDVSWITVSARDMGRLQLTTVKMDTLDIPANMDRSVCTVGSTPKVAPLTLKAFGRGCDDPHGKMMFKYTSSTEAGFSGGPVTAGAVEQASPVVLAVHLQANRSVARNPTNEGALFKPVAQFYEFAMTRMRALKEEGSYEFFLKMCQKYRDEIEDPTHKNFVYDEDTECMLLHKNGKQIAFTASEWATLTMKNKEGRVDFEYNMEMMEARHAAHEEFENDPNHERFDARERAEFYEFDQIAVERMHQMFDREQKILAQAGLHADSDDDTILEMDESDAEAEEEAEVRAGNSLRDDAALGSDAPYRSRESAVERARKRSDEAVQDVFAKVRESGAPSALHQQMLDKYAEIEKRRNEYDAKLAECRNALARREAVRSAENIAADLKLKAQQQADAIESEARKNIAANALKIAEVQQRIDDAARNIEAQRVEIEERTKREAEKKLANVVANQEKQLADGHEKLRKLTLLNAAVQQRCADATAALKKAEDDAEIERRAATEHANQQKQLEDTKRQEEALMRKIRVAEAEAVAAAARLEELRVAESKAEDPKAAASYVPTTAAAAPPAEAAANCLPARAATRETSVPNASHQPDLESERKEPPPAAVQQESAISKTKAKHSKADLVRSKEVCDKRCPSFEMCTKTHPGNARRLCVYNPCAREHTVCEFSHADRIITIENGKRRAIPRAVIEGTGEYARTLLKGDPEKQAAQRVLNAQNARVKSTEKRVDQEKLAAEAAKFIDAVKANPKTFAPAKDAPNYAAAVAKRHAEKENALPQSPPADSGDESKEQSNEDDASDELAAENFRPAQTRGTAPAPTRSNPTPGSPSAKGSSAPSS